MTKGRKFVLKGFAIAVIGGVMFRVLFHDIPTLNAAGYKGLAPFLAVFTIVFGFTLIAAVDKAWERP